MGDAASKRNVVLLRPARPRRVKGHQVGRLIGRDDRGPLIECEATGGPLAARSTVPLDEAYLEAPCDVLLVFEDEHFDRPIIVGLLRADGPGPRGIAPVACPPERAEAPLSGLMPGAEAKVDGRRVVLSAEEEIVLQCGEASITLRRNGRLVIRGAYVETRAQGVNRIKGGSVQIN